MLLDGTMVELKLLALAVIGPTEEVAGGAYADVSGTYGYCGPVKLGTEAVGMLDGEVIESCSVSKF